MCVFFCIYLGNDTGSSSSMPPGIVAAIVVCALFFLVLFIFAFVALYFFMRAKRQAQQNTQMPNHGFPASLDQDGSSNQDFDSGQLENVSNPELQPISNPVLTSHSPHGFQQARLQGDIYMPVPKPINKSVAGIQSHAPGQVQMGTGDASHDTGDRAETTSLDCNWSANPDFPTREVLSRIHDSEEPVNFSSPEVHEPANLPSSELQEPANLPSWEAILTRNYLPPFSKPLAKPAPSAPSLNDLDRVPEAPSRARDNLHSGTLASLDLHSRSLPNLATRSAFQLVKNRSTTTSAENLTIQSQSHKPYANFPVARSASVPLGIVQNDRSEYAVPLSVYKIPPRPRHVDNGLNHGFSAFGEINV